MEEKKEEQQQAAAQYSAKQLTEWKEAFGVFDKDNSGEIDSSELTKVFAELDPEMSKDDIDTMIQGADINADGTISFAEFCKMMATDDEEAVDAEDLELKA